MAIGHETMANKVVISLKDDAWKCLWSGEILDQKEEENQQLVESAKWGWKEPLCILFKILSSLILSDLLTFFTPLPIAQIHPVGMT